MKSSKKAADAYIAARLREKTTRPSTHAIDNDAARAVENVEKERKAFNVSREREAKSIASKILSPKKGR